jgi:plasmid stabilization system protein ParE
VKNVWVYRLARLEVAEAAGRYDEVSPDLGDALVEEFGTALRQLSEFPLSTPVVMGEIRKRPLFRFPYSIFYRVKMDEVHVIAFVHQHRGPIHLADRLQDEVDEG